jgi:hypothetical protein
MALSAVDELKIFENVLAQSPQGLNDPELIGKFTKAKSYLHRLDSLNQIQTQQNMTTQASPQGAGGMIPSQQGNPTPQGQLGATGLENQQNQPSMQQGGQGTLNLPQ